MGSKKTMKLSKAKLTGVTVVDLKSGSQCTAGSCSFLAAVECIPAGGRKCTADGSKNVGIGNGGIKNFGERIFDASRGWQGRTKGHTYLPCVTGIPEGFTATPCVCWLQGLETRALKMLARETVAQVRGRLELRMYKKAVDTLLLLCLDMRIAKFGRASLCNEQWAWRPACLQATGEITTKVCWRFTVFNRHASPVRASALLLYSLPSTACRELLCRVLQLWCC